MQNGNALPVSAFVDHADGTVPLGTAAYEKRGVAIDVPVWNPDACLQCNLCSYVCPHAVIRPVVMDDAAAAKAPGASVAMKGLRNSWRDFSVIAPRRSIAAA